MDGVEIIEQSHLYPLISSACGTAELAYTVGELQVSNLASCFGIVSRMHLRYSQISRFQCLNGERSEGSEHVSESHNNLSYWSCKQPKSQDSLIFSWFRLKIFCC